MGIFVKLRTAAQTAVQEELRIQRCSDFALTHLPMHEPRFLITRILFSITLT